MNDLIQIKSGTLGNRTEMPNLNIGELGYRTDEKALYIGTANGNVRLCDVFYAIHGETTSQEVRDALNSGKLVICKLFEGELLYLIVDCLTGNSFTFSSIDTLKITTVELSQNVWTDPVTCQLATQDDIERLNARIDALSSAE